MATMATTAFSLAIPQTPTTGGPLPPFPTTVQATFFQGDGTCMMDVGSNTLQADYCTDLLWSSISIAQAPNNSCSFTVYSGSTTCGSGASEKTSYPIPAGGGTICVDVGVLDPTWESASGVWSCA